MTVKELHDVLEKLIKDGKENYIVSLDGYKDVDIDIDDEFEELRFW